MLWKLQWHGSPQAGVYNDEFVLTKEPIATFDMSDAPAPKGWKPPLK